MSEDSFQEFLTKIQQDAGLQKALHDRFGDPAAGIPIQDLAEFAAGKGYKFTVEEISGRLSDAQLDAVSGGRSELCGKGIIQNGLGLNQKSIVRLPPFGDKM
jgi:predicted ribosomally synthesized peptide with nif11-like leader